MNAARLDPDATGRFRLSGELGFHTVPELWQQTRTLFHDCRSLTIDLSGVERSDSAGLALLVEWMREAARCGAELHFVNMPPQMLAIARVSSLDRILPLTRE